jgi:hypothetical protein
MSSIIKALMSDRFETQARFELKKWPNEMQQMSVWNMGLSLPMN